jgi:hypothetical protein
LKPDTTGRGLVSQAGGALLTNTVAATGLGCLLSKALAPWRKPLAVHDPAKVLLDLAIATAIGGDCLSDVNQLRASPAVFGLVASDPTVSRLVDTLALDPEHALRAIDTARAQARCRAWALAGTDSPGFGVDADHPHIIDIDATLVTAHSEKERAAANRKHGFGFHPMCAWIDHGVGGTGEPAAMMLRPGNAGANTAVDHITVAKQALAQLPGHQPGTRPGRKVLVRADSGGGTKEFLTWANSQRLAYSVGFGLTEDHVKNIELLPDTAWTAAINSDRTPRDGAWVADVTGVLTLKGWPKGMRVLVRAERPHPGAQLRFTDLYGNRLTAFATNTSTGQHADLELRHRQRARCEDRIRAAKDSGLTNLPLRDFNQNRIWLAVVMLAADITAWAQLLALTGSEARTWEPKRLRHRLFAIPARLGRRNRNTWLRLAGTAPHAPLLAAGIRRLQNLTTAA